MLISKSEIEPDSFLQSPTFTGYRLTFLQKLIVDGENLGCYRCRQNEQMKELWTHAEYKIPNLFPLNSNARGDSDMFTFI